MSARLLAVINAWKTFDLHNTQQELDETAAEITAKQDESEVSRKRLVDQLKDFKRNSTEEVRRVAAPIIKGFQNEVDFLSKRSKHSELAFLKVYQKFIDIVDPVPNLEYCLTLEKKVGTQADLEIENRTIRETLKEYNEELREVRNQEVTLKNLKEKLRKYEEEFESTVCAQVKVAEQSLLVSYSEKEELLHETHRHAVQKLKESEDRCQILQQSLEQSQSELFEVKNKLEEFAQGKSEENEILLNDLERANQRAIAAQKELTELKKQKETNIDTKNQHEGSGLNSLEYSSLQAELVSKDKEISQLISDIKQLQSSLKLLRDSSSGQISKLEDEVNANKTTLSNYEKRIKQQEDYDDIKRELVIIKSVEFDSIEDLSSKGSTSDVSKPLELLLLEKNKSLQNDNTSLKLSNETLNNKSFELEKENIELKTVISEQRMLIMQLESDLMSVQTMSPVHSGREREGSVSQIDFISEALKDMAENENADAVTDNFQTRNNDIGSPVSPSASETLLSIVSAQRERFRYRNEELEAEISARGNQILLLQNELDSLRGDNLKLYEKIRFLQSYQNSNKHTIGETYTESLYSNKYEKSLDPFMRFSQKEKHRHYASLSPFEKITLSFGRFVLTNKQARTATFIYVSVLHCLVFLVLYKLAFTESCKRDFSSECAQKFAEHMLNVHGET